jgi:hypothetical protein
MGVNPSSGAGLALMHDDQNATALAAAGAQTNARKQARDKAEQMIGIAAGSGAAGFGTGMSAGALATGAGTAAANASTVGNSTLNGVNAGVNAGYAGINSSFNGVGSNYKGSGLSGMGVLDAGQYGSPLADFASGAIGGAMKSGLFSGSSSNPYTTPGTGGSYQNPAGDTYDYTGGGGIYGSAGDYSDARLKKDIVRIGTSRRGYPWYSWKWKTGGRGEGVIAQEVMTMDPCAVCPDRDGVLMVDYARV